MLSNSIKFLFYLFIYIIWWVILSNLELIYNSRAIVFYLYIHLFEVSSSFVAQINQKYIFQWVKDYVTATDVSIIPGFGLFFFC